MDKAKASLAALTFHDQARHTVADLHGWVGRWLRILPAQQIYIVLSGEKNVTVAPGCNIIFLPAVPALSVQIQEAILAHQASALTQFYNWVICTAAQDRLFFTPPTEDALLHHLILSQGQHQITPQPIEIAKTTAGGFAFRPIEQRSSARLISAPVCPPQAEQPGFSRTCPIDTGITVASWVGETPPVMSEPIASSFRELPGNFVSMF